MARYLKLSKDKIIYFQHSPLYILPTVHIWSDDTASSVEHIPRVVCKYTEPFDGWSPPPLIFKELELRDPIKRWAFQYFFLDFIFIERRPYCGLLDFELRFKSINAFSQQVHMDIKISNSNSILLQRTKQCDIYAVALTFQEVLDSPSQVKAYLRALFTDASCGLHTLHQLYDCGIFITGNERKNLIRSMILQQV